MTVKTNRKISIITTCTHRSWKTYYKVVYFALTRKNVGCVINTEIYAENSLMKEQNS